ncbi:hypothetical protein CR513_54252, partial [Mucuna pruriens]
LKSYDDVDFAGDRIERKNTSGGCHFIGANLVSWISKSQVLGMDVRIDIPTIVTTTRKMYKVRWENPYEGMTAIEDAFFGVDVERPCALNMMHDKARIFQQMLNKGILHKAGSKDHLLDIHLLAMFHMNVIETFYALPITEQAKYDHSSRQKRFG